MIGLRPAFWMPARVDACIAEFHVVRSARRRGVGEAAARRILHRWRGRWEISEVAGNAPAIAFWRRTIGRLTRGHFEEVAVRGGLVQRFTMSGRRTRR
jgi:predicted acetyltransferase